MRRLPALHKVVCRRRFQSGTIHFRCDRLQVWKCLRRDKGNKARPRAGTGTERKVKSASPDGRVDCGGGIGTDARDPATHLAPKWKQRAPALARREAHSPLLFLGPRWSRRTGATGKLVGKWKVESETVVADRLEPSLLPGSGGRDSWSRLVTKITASYAV